MKKPSITAIITLLSAVIGVFVVRSGILVDSPFYQLTMKNMIIGGIIGGLAGFVIGKFAEGKIK